MGEGTGSPGWSRVFNPRCLWKTLSYKDPRLSQQDPSIWRATNDHMGFVPQSCSLLGFRLSAIRQPLLSFPVFCCTRSLGNLIIL